MAFCSNCGKEIDDESKFCSYCGSPVKNNIKPTVISDKSGTVIIYRQFGIQDLLAPYKIFVDSKESGTIKNNENKFLKLKYGEHTIQFMGKWNGKVSKILKFQLNDEHSNVKVTCSCYDKLATTIGVLLAYTGPDDEYIKAFFEYL